MFRLTSNLVRSRLVLFVAFALLGLSGGLVYGSCTTTECTNYSILQIKTAGGNYFCKQLDETVGTWIYSAAADGNKNDYPGTHRVDWTEYAGKCSGCECSGTQNSENDVKCTGREGSTIRSTGDEPYTICYWNIPS